MDGKPDNSVNAQELSSKNYKKITESENISLNKNILLNIDRIYLRFTVILINATKPRHNLYLKPSTNYQNTGKQRFLLKKIVLLVLATASMRC